MNRTFTPEELSLLATIHADPRNDTPRLVYADWLEEHGQPEYAELIRLQSQPLYIGVVYHPPGPPAVSCEFEMDWMDPEATTRLKRLLGLAPHAYRVDRPGQFYEELFRGLPLLQVELRDRHAALALRLAETIGPLARLVITLRTARLSTWLTHPVMERAEILRIDPVLPPDAEMDYDGTMNSHRDFFWAANIPTLAASPLMDRLYELNPRGVQSTSYLTARSRQNMALCGELLEPRVFVEYSY